jgi:YHS domain-containing protein
MPELMTDPVCGMDLGVRGAIASAVTEGRRFYFCCLRCHAAFLDTPHRFVGWAGDPSRPLRTAVATRTRVGLEPCHFAS